MVAELLAPKTEHGVELDREPARLVPPVLEDRLAGLEELLGEGRVKAVEPGVKDDGVAARAGDRDGVELEVTKALDDASSRRPGAFPMTRSAPGHFGPLRFEEAGPTERQPPCGTDIDRLGHAFDEVP